MSAEIARSSLPALADAGSGLRARLAPRWRIIAGGVDWVGVEPATGLRVRLTLVRWQEYDLLIIASPVCDVEDLRADVAAALNRKLILGSLELDGGLYVLRCTLPANVQDDLLHEVVSYFGEQTLRLPGAIRACAPRDKGLFDYWAQ